MEIAKESIKIQAVLTSKADKENWMALRKHYKENYNDNISDAEVIKRVLEQQANRTKSRSRNSTINQTWWLVFDIWSKITGNELTVEEINEMIEADMGRSMYR